MSVEQAAERLRRWWKAIDDNARDSHEYAVDPDGIGQLTADEEAIQRAYLDLFDPTPLSEEILRASGVTDTWDDYEGTVAYRIGCNFGVCFANDIGAHLMYETKYDWKVLRELKTVGDLRRLLSALHIDCQVVVPESEAKQ